MVPFWAHNSGFHKNRHHSRWYWEHGGEGGRGGGRLLQAAVGTRGNFSQEPPFGTRGAVFADRCHHHRVIIHRDLQSSPLSFVPNSGVWSKGTIFTGIVIHSRRYLEHGGEGGGGTTSHSRDKGKVFTGVGIWNNGGGFHRKPLLPRTTGATKEHT